MKRIALGLLCLTLLTSCGQSDQAKAKALVAKSCNSHVIPKTESLIREAVQLDEKYRPYLIAWLNWQNGTEEMNRASKISQEAYEIAYKDFKNNFTIQDSYCQKVRN
jgi:hypothetical protein